MRMFMAEEKIDKPEVAALEKLNVVVALLNHIKNSRGDVDHRGIAIAVTHIQTAMLWIRDAVRVED
jgi:hypothetical protein